MSGRAEGAAGATPLTYLLTAEDYMNFNLHVQQTSAVHRRQLTLMRAGGALVISGGCFALLGAVDTNVAMRAVIAVVTAVICWLIFPALHRSTTKRYLQRLAAGPGLGPTGQTNLWLDARGIHEDVAGIRTSVEWASVRRVEEDDAYCYIFASEQAAFILPRRAGHEMVAWVRDTVRDRTAAQVPGA